MQAELKADLKAAWMAGGHLPPFDLATRLRCETVPAWRYRQAFHGLLSAEKFAQFFGTAGFEVLADSRARSGHWTSQYLYWGAS